MKNDEAISGSLEIAVVCTEVDFAIKKLKRLRVKQEIASNQIKCMLLPIQLKYWHLENLFDAIAFRHFYKS